MLENLSLCLSISVFQDLYLYLVFIFSVCPSLSLSCYSLVIVFDTLSPLSCSVSHSPIYSFILHILYPSIYPPIHSFSLCVANNYGQGVYFATEAEYSIRDAYATRNSRGDRHIFMCKVLVGEYTVGKPEMRFPPEIPGSNGRHCNSVVDDEKKPSTFVIFSDVQAYPEYLIVFM